MYAVERYKSSNEKDDKEAMLQGRDKQKKRKESHRIKSKPNEIDRKAKGVTQRPKPTVNIGIIQNRYSTTDNNKMSFSKT